MIILKCYSCGEDLRKSVVIAKRNEIRFNCYNSRKQIVKCGKCGLVQLIPQWANKELDKIYKDYNQQKDFPEQKVTSFRVSNYLKKYLSKEDSIMEVGCGAGDNVKYFRKLGYKSIAGIDKDPSVKNEKCNIFNYDIYDKAIDKNKVDTIYGLHILEHMKDPIGFIDRLKNLSNKMIILELPNLEDPLLTLYKVKEFEKFYYRPDHHFFFTPQTLASMLYGFKLGNCLLKRKQNYGVINHLNWLIRKKPTNFKMNIPIIDDIYKFILTSIFQKSDSILLIIKKERL